ncbi:MAG TPA: M1 family metallopeptidase [Bacteroidia bacterium]|jgi:aminopeptidase N|nr:M1 family metallopeptidase [Bacteroidia bacterium]
MKTLHKLIIPSSILFFALACGHTKHAANNNKPKPNWSMSLLAPYDSTINAESQPDYNPSATRLSDLLHTKLDVRFDWKKRYMYGKATISAKPYFYSQSTLELDARGMQINRVALLKRSTNNSTLFAEDTITAPYTYKDNKLVIQLGRSYTKDEEYTVFIDYVSKPDEIPVGGSAAINEDKGLYFINPDADPKDSVLHPRQIWTQGETQSNSVWMPTIDHPNERMTSEIYMTVEDKYVTLSNGLLFDQKKNADGTRTDHWRMDLPSAPYLVMMAVGSFTIVKDSWKGKEVSYYVEPQFANDARVVFGHTPDMIDFFSKKLGVDFQWAKYSQICARDYVSGAMENTTATLHSDFLQQDSREVLDESYEDYISHELFHQWFGDLVTCESWSNLPLNESFATYGEYLWNEFRYGKEEADYGHYSSLHGYLRESAAGRRTEQWPGVREPLIRFYYEDREDMFDGHSYNKGGQVLHLLRQYVGDDAFFASLKLYLETKKFSSGEVDDLRLAFEQTTGQDLRWFFNEWFMERGHPELDIAYDYDAVKMKQRVIIKQTQDRTDGTPIFRIPLSIDLYSGGKTTRQEVIVKSLCDTFYFDAATKPDIVNVDAQKTLPCFKADHHNAAEWAFLYNNSTLYVDRVEAINALAQNLKVSRDKPNPDYDLSLQIVSKALKDEFWAIRNLACSRIDNNANQVDGVKDILIKLAQGDPKAAVRASALDALADASTDDNLKPVFMSCINDSSYNVITSALLALTKNFPKDGMVQLAKMENDPSRDIKTAVGSAYAYYGTDDQQAWFQKTLPTLCGSFQTYFIQEYGSLLRRCSLETINKALPQWEDLYNSTSSPSIKLYLKGTLKDISRYFQSTSADLQKQYDDLKQVKNNATGLQKLADDKAKADDKAAAINAVVARLK